MRREEEIKKGKRKQNAKKRYFFRKSSKPFLNSCMLDGSTGASRIIKWLFPDNALDEYKDPQLACSKVAQLPTDFLPDSNSDAD